VKIKQKFEKYFLGCFQMGKKLPVASDFQPQKQYQIKAAGPMLRHVAKVLRMESAEDPF
jgi:hypothetical protein